jgi:ATP synthase protein I
VLREAAPYLGMGTTLAASVLVGVGAGYWLDGQLGTSPWLLLAGALLGIFGGLFQVYKTVAGGKKQ